MKGDVVFTFNFHSILKVPCFLGYVYPEVGCIKGRSLLWFWLVC